MIRWFAVFVLSLPLAAQTSDLKTLKQAAVEMTDARAKFTQVMVDSIFSFSELGYQEVETSRYVTGLLEKEGFQITRGVAGLPTAFVASWGSGKPVIGLMADIDGLPETSQKPGVAYHAPLIEGGPGHGEGHNAGQAVAVTAALTVKALMQKHKIPGTIRVYPGVAEEQLGSRNYMVRAGLFNDVDVMLSSHIASTFGTAYGPAGNTGLVSTVYTFHGRSAHSAGSPWAGRSALDAVELMNIGWNYRREHLRLDQRSHYVVVNGGSQPNVVPSEASVWYYFRERDYEHIKELHQIGTTIANAAASMTDTTMTERIMAATWPGYWSKPIAEAMHKNIEAVGMPVWSEADQTLAKAMQAELKAKQDGLPSKIAELQDGTKQGGGNAGSDDISEVSWTVPTIVLRYPGNIPGMVGHHWSSGVSMATPIAHKGALAGAKAQALTALDILMQPELVQAAKAYFAEQTKATKWVSLIPDGVQPPIELNRDKMEKALPQLQKLRYDPSKYGTYMEQLGIRYPTVRSAP